MGAIIEIHTLARPELAHKTTGSFDATKQYEVLRRHYQSTVTELRKGQAITSGRAESGFQNYIRELWTRLMNKLATTP